MAHSLVFVQETDATSSVSVKSSIDNNRASTIVVSFNNPEENERERADNSLILES